jgi:glucose/arabinose dehydrogenase
LVAVFVRTFLHLAVMVAALAAAFALFERIHVIPIWILWLSNVAMLTEDVVQVGIILLAFVLAIGLPAAILTRGHGATNGEAGAIDLFSWLYSVSLALTVAFVATELPFSPNFWVILGLGGFAAHVVVQLALGVWKFGLRAGIGGLLGAYWRRLLSVAGLILVLIAALPVVAAFAYKKDPAIANYINSLRRDLAGEYATAWGFTPVPGGRFHQPMAIDFSGPGVAYVLERFGRLVRVNWPQGIQRETVLDLSSRMGPIELENGVLGFALHPEFATVGHSGAGKVFIYYTIISDEGARLVLSRFDLRESTPQARLASESILIDQKRRVANGFHNGGAVDFGPDGFLYIGVGEASDLKVHQRFDAGLYAGVFRIDVDNLAGETSSPVTRQPPNGRVAAYSIPNDNPFVDRDDVLDEYWAVGLRNPFRFSFDVATGALWIGDVGAATYEEVNRAMGGENFQFPYIEGANLVHKPTPSPLVGRDQGPYYSYRHSALDRAVIGGVVYRHERWPDLRGKYVFGDNYSGRVMTLNLGVDEPQMNVIAKTSQLGQLGISGFAQSPDGHLLVLTLGRKDSPTGQIQWLSKGGGEPAATSVVTDDAPTLKDMRERYASECARCHGESGHPSKAVIAELGVTMPDFASAAWQQSRTDEGIYKVIAQGGAANGLSALMPPWSALYSPEQLRLLVGIVRGFKSPE